MVSFKIKIISCSELKFLNSTFYMTEQSLCLNSKISIKNIQVFIDYSYKCFITSLYFLLNMKVFENNIKKLFKVLKGKKVMNLDIWTFLEREAIIWLRISLMKMKYTTSFLIWCTSTLPVLEKYVNVVN